MTGAATMYADAAQLALAVSRLRPGHSITYAVGPATDPAHPTVQLVTRLREEGAVRVHANGRDSTGQLRHVVVRRDPNRPDPAPRATSREEGLRVRLEAAGIEGRTLRDCVRLAEVLTGCARRGEVCPSNADLAATLNLRDRERAKYLLKLLTRAQVIAVVSRPPHPRVVQLVGTRLATADEAGVLDSARAAPAVAAEIRKVFG